MYAEALFYATINFLVGGLVIEAIIAKYTIQSSQSLWMLVFSDY